MYENRTMKPVEIPLKKWGGGMWSMRDDGGDERN
jgi:hypothetical protein